METVLKKEDCVELCTRQDALDAYKRLSDTDGQVSFQMWVPDSVQFVRRSDQVSDCSIDDLDQVNSTSSVSHVLLPHRWFRDHSLS